MQRLIYIMDPMCSWCWGFAPVVEALAEQAAAVDVSLHLVVGGLRRERTPLDPSLRDKVLGHWRTVTQATGQTFNFDNALPQGFIYDSSLACQALVVARTLQADQVLQYARAVQQAFYCDQQAMGDPQTFVQLAGACGFDEALFAQGLDQETSQSATLADFEWAARLGIVGFPTLLAERNGQLALLTNGYQPFAVLSPLLGRWLAQAARV